MYPRLLINGHFVRKHNEKKQFHHRSGTDLEPGPIHTLHERINFINFDL